MNLTKSNKLKKSQLNKGFLKIKIVETFTNEKDRQ